MIDKLIKTKTLLIYVEVDSLKRNIELDEQQKEFFELVNSTDVDVVEQNFNKQKVPETKNFINKNYSKIGFVKFFNCVFYAFF